MYYFYYSQMCPNYYYGNYMNSGGSRLINSYVNPFENFQSKGRQTTDYQKGYFDGYNEGYDECYDNNYDDIYSEGHKEGYDRGYEVSYGICFDKGYDDGYEAGSRKNRYR